MQNNLHKSAEGWVRYHDAAKQRRYATRNIALLTGKLDAGIKNIVRTAVRSGVQQKIEQLSAESGVEA